jgi:hypothetical protein
MRAPRAAPICQRTGLILCALLLLLAYFFAKPDDALGGRPIPPVFENCLVYNCATITVGSSGGKGYGTIKSSPEGINCTVTAGVDSGACEHTFLFSESSLTVKLTFTAGPGTVLAPPPKDFLEVVHDIPLVDEQKTSVSWTFVLTQHTLSVTKTGAGTGKVTSSPPGFDCPSTCAQTYEYGTQVAVTATPDAGAVFKAWTGACAGQGATCTLTIQADSATNVVFELPEATGGATGGSTETALGATKSGKADAAVAASVVRTRSSKSPLGKRIVQLELNLKENVSATLILRRAKKTLLTKQLTRVRPGNRLLTLRIPKGIGKGKATLVFKFKDPVGNTFSGSRAIKIAAL